MQESMHGLTMTQIEPFHHHHHHHPGKVPVVLPSHSPLGGHHYSDFFTDKGGAGI